MPAAPGTRYRSAVSAPTAAMAGVEARSENSHTSAESRVPMPQNEIGSSPAKIAAGMRAEATVHGTNTPAAFKKQSICSRCKVQSTSE
jgi:hypothetical protein